MSADNYMYVFPLPNGRFGVTMRFASSDYDSDPRSVPNSGLSFKTIQEAMEYANDEASGINDDYGYGCEYGVIVSPKIKLRTTYTLL